MAEQSNKFPAAKNQAAKAADVAPSEEHEILEQLKEYVLPVALGAGAAVLVFLGVYGYKAYKQSIRDKASMALITADSPEKLQSVLMQFPQTPVAPVALLSLASERFHDQQYGEALDAYQRFIADYPENLMVPSAHLGKAYCAEAMGNFDNGIEAFQGFLKDYPGHFLKPLATFGQARCLARMSKHEEARTLYEDFIAENPDSQWISQAELALRYIEMDQRSGTSKAATAPKPELKMPDLTDKVSELPEMKLSPVETPEPAKNTPAPAKPDAAKAAPTPKPAPKPAAPEIKLADPKKPAPAKVAPIVPAKAEPKKPAEIPEALKK